MAGIFGPTFSSLANAKRRIGLCFLIKEITMNRTYGFMVSIALSALVLCGVSACNSDLEEQRAALTADAAQTADAQVTQTAIAPATQTAAAQAAQLAQITLVEIVGKTETPMPTVQATPDTLTPVPTIQATPDTPTVTSIPLPESISEILAGMYTVNFTIASDPLGQNSDINMPPMLPIQVVTHSIDFIGPAPFVNVSGPLNPDGTFDLTAAGDVAGRHNIGVEFVGKITSSGVTGKYSMGVKVPAIINGRKDFGGYLQGGQPIIFDVQGQKMGAPTAAAPIAIDPRLKSFLDNFVPAIRTNDATFLMPHLHPAVLNLYGADQCQASLNKKSADPTYNIMILGVQGPAPWQYVASGISTTVQDVYTLDANVTAQGQTQKTQLHFAVVGSDVNWFTACGTPLLTPTPTH